MRTFCLAFVIAFLFGHCNDRDNPAITGAGPGVVGRLEYSLSPSSMTLGINDTIKVDVSVFNHGADTDTLIIGSDLVRWSLKNSNGDTLDYGPKVFPLSLRKQPLSPNQSLVISQINEPLVHVSGHSLLPGRYMLEVVVGRLPILLRSDIIVVGVEPGGGASHLSIPASLRSGLQ